MTDRELDAEVAEKVMGLIPNGSGGFSNRSGSRQWLSALRYSTEIAAAMSVVEKMQGKGFVVLMRNVNKWYVEFSPKTLNAKQDFGRAQHDSLAMAICLAALSAVRGE